MAQSYTRQSTFADGDTISASLFNNEYNQLVNSFAYSSTSAVNTGHRHDGTAGQGGNIFKIGDLDFLNKIEVDGTNNRLGFYVEVSSSAVEQVRIQDGVIVPVTDNDIDLGTSSLQFKDLYINGTANLDSLVLGSGSTVTAILDEDGLTSDSATSLATQQSIKAYVDAQVTAQDFDFSADSGGALSIDLDSEAMTFTGGTGIDTSGSGNAVTFAIDSTVATLADTQTFTNKTLTSPDINGGTVDGATIATSDITVGAGKTLDVSAGTLTLADDQISGDKVEGGTIAATTITDLTFGSLDDGTINITAFVDEDNMSSDSATLVPTQQSVKAYVDAQVTAQDLDVTTDSGTIAIDLDSENLTVTGGTGIDSSATGNAVTLAIDSTVATLAGSQTLTNKTLTTPVVSGNLTTDGLIDGRDVATDGTKLDGIEASADVTDTTNVTAAGALMDSEVTNLAQVKAFDSSDYATAAQGTTADAALPRTGGAMTGAITTNSTFDGRDVATDGAKLDGIEASADVTDTANVTAAGALMDSELTSEASVKALNQGVATTDSPVFTNLTLNGTGSVKVPAGTTAQRDGSPAAGMFRYNSSLAQFEGYTDDWGAIGGGGTNTFTTDSFTGNGSTTAYALSQSVSSEDNLLVFIEGVFQQQDAYSIATVGGVTTLTFSSAPANGNSILIYSVAAGVSGSNLNIDSMTGDGSDVTLTLTINPVNENNTQVFIDGVYQSKSNYSISGTTLTFSTAPPNGSAVEVMTMTQTDINVPVDGTITSAKLSGDLTLPGDLSFADNNKAIFGAGSDLQIYHDGSHSYIDDVGGTGNLKIRATNLVLQSAIDENYATFVANGAASLFHDNAVKLATTSTGIDVTGTVTADGLNFNVADGVEINALESLVFDIDSDNNQTGRVFQVKTNNTTPLFTINDGGNVGIGTTSPTSRLQLDGAEDRTGGLTLSAGGQNHTYFLSSDFVNVHNIETGSSAAAHTWQTNGTERLRITSAGNVGINQSSPLFAFCISDGSNPNRNGMEIAIGTSDTASNTIQNYNRATAAYTPLSIGASILTFSTGTSAVEVMRIDAGGNLLVGTTSNSDTSGEGFKFKPDGEGTDKPRLSISTAGFQTETCLSIYSTAVSALRFAVNAAGTISATNTTITSLSDQRVKENVRDLDDGLTKVLQLQPRKFDWKEGQGRDISNDRGFIAQEFEQVFPDMIEEWKDKAPEGGEPYKAINANLIPTLVKAIQEQQETITALTARIETLENN